MKATKFWSKIRRDENGCWIWTGRKDSKGYGRVDNTVAHRIAWLFTYGSLPSSLCVCHACDVRLCINPAHLFLGTQKDNIQDAARKGRMPPPLVAGGRCGNGHQLDDNNIESFRRKTGEIERVCRLCRIARRDRFRAGRKTRTSKEGA